MHSRRFHRKLGTTIKLLSLCCFFSVQVAQAFADERMAYRVPIDPSTVGLASGQAFNSSTLSTEPVSYPRRDYEPQSSFTSIAFEDGAVAPPLYQFAPGTLGSPTEMSDGFSFSGLARAYYLNDQRIEWSGQEATYGAEAIVAGGASRDFEGWQTGVCGELYLNQPFDLNILVDTTERVSYRGNFEYETFELSQLYLHTRRGDWLFALGKMTTPFGRTYFPVYTNDRLDAPFIRTESILWRETGLLLQYDPGIWTLTTALMNGGPDRDANSSKALVARVGIDTATCAIGASAKWQDGIGSEDQKITNNHVGIDAMIRRGPFTLSGEAIYDQYGFRRDTFDPNNITWGRSIYYRDQNYRPYEPITGFGYYVDLVYAGEKWLCQLNYGEFYPKQIGDPLHDTATRRALVKAVRHLNPFTDFYSALTIENDLPNAQAGRTRKGLALLAGFQVSL